MRPIFIYHYEKDMNNRAREFYDLFMHDGEMIEKDYQKATAQHRMEEKSNQGGTSAKSASSKFNNDILKSVTSVGFKRKEQQIRQRESIRGNREDETGVAHQETP